MAMVDTAYDGHIFKLSKVFWANDLIAAELKRLKVDKKEQPADDEEGSAPADVTKCKRLSLRIPKADFAGKQMMVILCDRYGNEKKLVFEQAIFNEVTYSTRLPIRSLPYPMRASRLSALSLSTTLSSICCVTGNMPSSAVPLKPRSLFSLRRNTRTPRRWLLENFDVGESPL